MKTRIVQNKTERSGFRRGGSNAAQARAADVTGSSATTSTNGFRAYVSRRELVIFFALTYLIAWSTVPFGSFLAFSPAHVGNSRGADRRRLDGAGSARSARHSLASELDMVRGCDRPAALWSTRWPSV